LPLAGHRILLADRKADARWLLIPKKGQIGIKEGLGRVDKA
jgi:hypothetical protein